MTGKKATVGEGTTIGEYCVIEDGAVIGKGCRIGHHVVIRAGTVIGDNVRIDDFASVGKLPMKAANSAVTGDGALPPARIGNGALIGTGAVLYAGSVIADRVLIADLATVREKVIIGKKTIVGRGVCIENCCNIGCECKLETNSYLCAYSSVEDGCFIAPGVVTSNDNYAGRSRKRFSCFKGLTLKKGARIGAGAVVLPGREIGPDGFAAAGSVVTRDIEPGTIAAGCPARELRKVPEDQLLENQK